MRKWTVFIQQVNGQLREETASRMEEHFWLLEVKQRIGTYNTQSTKNQIYQGKKTMPSKEREEGVRKFRTQGCTHGPR